MYLKSLEVYIINPVMASSAHEARIPEAGNSLIVEAKKPRRALAAQIDTVK